MYTIAIEVRGGCVVGVSSFGAGPQDIYAVVVDYDNIEEGDRAGEVEVVQLEDDEDLAALVREVLDDHEECPGGCGRDAHICKLHEDLNAGKCGDIDDR